MSATIYQLNKPANENAAPTSETKAEAKAEAKGDNNVVQLVTERDECVESVIKRLEEALEEARQGNIKAVAIAVVRPEGAINSSISQSDDAGRLLGAIALLQWRAVHLIEVEE